MVTSLNVEYILSTLNNWFWNDVIKSFLDINYKQKYVKNQFPSPLFFNRFFLYHIAIDRSMYFTKHGRIQVFLKELLQWLNNNDIKCDLVEEPFIFCLNRLNT